MPAAEAFLMRRRNDILRIRAANYSNPGDGSACTIYAVDDRCCACPSIFAGGSTEICPSCRAGLVDNTQPLKIGSGGYHKITSITLMVAASGWTL
eukprot:scaffold182840_cov45-Prasinocladus_malaysianus.AAC.1